MRFGTGSFDKSVFAPAFTESPGYERNESGFDFTPAPIVSSRLTSGTKAHYGLKLYDPSTSVNPNRRYLRLDTIESVGTTVVFHCRDLYDRYTGAHTREWIVEPVCWGYSPNDGYHFTSWPMQQSDPPDPGDGGFWVSDTEWQPYDVPQCMHEFGGSGSPVMTQAEADAYLATLVNGYPFIWYMEGATLEGNKWSLTLNSSNAWLSSWTGGDRFHDGTSCVVTQEVSNEYTFDQLRTDAISAATVGNWTGGIVGTPYETYDASNGDYGWFSYCKVDLRLQFAGYGFATAVQPVDYYEVLAKRGQNAVWVAATTKLIEATAEVPAFDPGYYYETEAKWVFFNQVTDYLYTHQLETAASDSPSLSEDQFPYSNEG